MRINKVLQFEILRSEDKIVLITLFCLIPNWIEIRYIACNLIDHITLINDRSYWMCKRSAGFLTMTQRLKQHPLYQHDEQLTSYKNYEKRLLLVVLAHYYNMIKCQYKYSWDYLFWVVHSFILFEIWWLWCVWNYTI